MRPPERAAPRRQRGIAVITAMLVVAIATIIAVEMAWNTNLDLRRTAGLMAWDQAREYAYFGEVLAIETLEEKLKGNGQAQVYERDYDEQARRGINISQDDKSLTGGISDLDGRFNLNNLVSRQGKPDELVVKQFRRLIEAVATLDPELEIGPADVEVIVASTVDWIDPDSTADFNGAEDDFYTSEPEPYRAANAYFTSVSEIRAVRGVTPEIYAALKPYLAALPVGAQHTKINFNTASAPVLMSLGDNVSVDNASRWIEDTRKEAVKDVPSVSEGLIDQAMFGYVDVTSSHFALEGFVSIGTNRLDMYSLLEWDGQAVKVRLRNFGIVADAEPAEPALDASADEAGKMTVSPKDD